MACGTNCIFGTRFTGCTHRLKHRVNILWNRHVIHHSSEDFNLACVLRQSISNCYKLFYNLYDPRSIISVPVKIFVILGPIHFFQFWYHTQLIGKMGIFEYFLVTPSHHRVHHAINQNTSIRTMVRYLFFGINYLEHFRLKLTMLSLCTEH